MSSSRRIITQSSNQSFINNTKIYSTTTSTTLTKYVSKELYLPTSPPTLTRYVLNDFENDFINDSIVYDDNTFIVNDNSTISNNTITYYSNFTNMLKNFMMIFDHDYEIVEFDSSYTPRSNMQRSTFGNELVSSWHFRLPNIHKKHDPTTLNNIFV
ncbi:unnamed protein product [Adineta steineri]|uniref:Uncharacterized protein n=1 Tax=Adineta steineri TaxID=433720 RepID=A0A815B5K4_9BILA|nr:unnamed protein product [Adineta steineri]CAF1317339.1 unnamed protein product [Adineta steineri]CAF3554502.1 unnamed protein product [Adineta steineri]CAF3586850.1 unnamed protein product [Adineta steineri]